MTTEERKEYLKQLTNTIITAAGRSPQWHANQTKVSAWDVENLVEADCMMGSIRDSITNQVTEWIKDPLGVIVGHIHHEDMYIGVGLSVQERTQGILSLMITVHIMLTKEDGTRYWIT